MQPLRRTARLTHLTHLARIAPQTAVGILGMLVAISCWPASASSAEPQRSPSGGAGPGDAGAASGTSGDAGAAKKSAKSGVLAALFPPAQGVTELRIDKTPPDPEPAMREEMQWVFDLRYERGDVFFVGVHSLDLGAPQTTPRVMGRFALELFEGPTLIERVRFDFPMLGTGDHQNKAYLSPPSFEKKLTTRIGVMFPQSKRGTRLELWDRATNQRYRLPWPPEARASGAAEGARASGAESQGDASTCDGGCARTE